MTKAAITQFFLYGNLSKYLLIIYYPSFEL